MKNVVFYNNNPNPQYAYHDIVIVENNHITHLDALANYTFNRGQITINDNLNLSNFCGLTKIISEIEYFLNEEVYVANNAFNPSKQDMLNGNCSLE